MCAQAALTYRAQVTLNSRQPILLHMLIRNTGFTDVNGLLPLSNMAASKVILECTPLQSTLHGMHAIQVFGIGVKLVHVHVI